jgi:hypothetical protein
MEVSAQLHATAAVVPGTRPFSSPSLYRLSYPGSSPKLGRLVTGFPTRRPGFDPRSRHVAFVLDKMTLSQVFSEYFGIPLPFLFHGLLDTHLSSGAGTMGPRVAGVRSGLSLTPRS